MLDLFLLLHMNSYLLVIFLADSIRLKSNLYINTSMGRDRTIRRDITKGRSRVSVADPCPDFLKNEIYFEIANVFYLNCFFNELVKQNSTHTDQTIFRLYHHLRANSFAFQHTANCVFLSIKLKPLLKSLLLNRLELQNSPKV